MGSRRWFAAPLLAALALAAAAAPAGADLKQVKIKTEVRFLEVNTETYEEFGAKIAARKPCREDRRGSLWYKPAEDAHPERIATDRSNRKGVFDFDLSEPAVAGLYAIQVRKDVEHKHGTRIVCEPVLPLFSSF